MTRKSDNIKVCMSLWQLLPLPCQKEDKVTGAGPCKKGGSHISSWWQKQHQAFSFWHFVGRQACKQNVDYVSSIYRVFNSTSPTSMLWNCANCKLCPENLFTTGGYWYWDMLSFHIINVIKKYDKDFGLLHIHQSFYKTCDWGGWSFKKHPVATLRASDRHPNSFNPKP